MSIFPNHNLFVNGEDTDTDREVVVRKMTECVAMFCNVREKKKHLAVTGRGLPRVKTNCLLIVFIGRETLAYKFWSA